MSTTTTLTIDHTTTTTTNSSTITAHYNNAERNSDDSSLCKVKSIELLDEIHHPKDLLPLEEFEEVGYNWETSFMWLKQKKTTNHTFKKIGRVVSNASKITTFVEVRRMKKLIGVKSKEMLLWVTLSEMSVDAKDDKDITFKNTLGLSRSFLVSTFELEGEDMNKKEEEKEKVDKKVKVVEEEKMVEVAAVAN